jgi:hypothetical protein
MAARRSDPIPTVEATESAPASSRRATRRAKPKTKGNPGAAVEQVTEEARRAMIAKAAYFHAERRGFAPGGEAQDWLRAEAEVDALLRAAHPGRPQ